VRKYVDALSKDELDAIADQSIKDRVLAKLAELGGEPKKAFALPANHPWLETKTDEDPDSQGPPTEAGRC